MKIRNVVAFCTFFALMLLPFGTLGVPGALSAACGSGGTMDGISVPTAQASPTIAKICRDGVLRIAVAPFAPHGFQDTNGTYRGPGVEIVGPEAAKMLGVRLQILGVGWDTVVAGLQAGRYEIITTGLAYTPERAKILDYVLYAVAGTCYVVRKDSPVRTLQDLNSPNVTIGVYTGTSWATDLPKIFPNAKFDAAVQGPGGEERVTDVLAKRITAAPINNVEAFAFQANYPSVRVIPAPAECMSNPLPKSHFGFGVPQDAAFQAFIAAIVQKDQSQINTMLLKYASPKYIDVGHE